MFCQKGRIAGKTAYLLLILLVLGALATACEPTAGEDVSSSPGASKRTGTREVSVVLDGDPPTLNPNFHGSAIATTVTSNIFDALFDRSRDGRIEPGLATEWENPRPELWTITLKQGVTFHNGDPLTAEDVVFSIERVLDEDLASPQRGTYSFISSVRAVDENTVEIATRGPYPPFLTRMSDLLIVPRDYYEEVGPEEFARRPVGTGPYRLVEWEHDQRLVTEAYRDHWRGRAEVDRVVWRVIPEDTTQVLELRAGGVDLVPGLPVDQVPGLESDPDITVKEVAITRTSMLPIDASEPPLDDRRVRRALNYAVDKEAIIEHILNGMGVLQRGILPPMVPGHDPDLEPYPYDPERARALLDEAGYGDGITIEFKATASRIPNARQIADALRGYWEDVGIETEFEFYPQIASWLKLWPDEAGPLPMCSWGGGLDPDFYYYPIVRSGNIYAVFTDPALDELIDRGRVTTDPQRRAQIYREAEKRLLAEAGFVFLWSQEAAFGIADRLNWEPRVDERIWAYGFSLSEDTGK